MDKLRNSVECVVPGCKNTDEDKFLKFYLLPYKDKEILKEWIVRIRNRTLCMIQRDGKTKADLKICEIHFHYTCKTEFNSGLHPLSLPTLHLPILANAVKAIYLNNMLDAPVATKMDCDDKINLEANMCPRICRVCYKGGLLYDIENSTYKDGSSLASIIKYLIPEYRFDKQVLKERICLDCVKQILNSYLTVKQFKSTSIIFSYLCPESSKLTALKQKRSVLISYPVQIDMKSILADCNLIFCNQNYKKYLPLQSVDKKDVPQTSSKTRQENMSKLTSRSNTSTKMSLNTTSTPEDPFTSDGIDNSVVNNTKQYSKRPIKNQSETIIIQQENMKTLEHNIDIVDIKVDLETMEDQYINDTLDSIGTVDIIEHDLNKVKMELEFSEGSSGINKANLVGFLSNQSKLINKEFKGSDIPGLFADLEGLNNTDYAHSSTHMQRSALFICNELNCQFICETQAVYTEHMQNHTSVLLGQFDCKMCGARCNDRKAYRVHLKIHKTDEQIQCAQCEKTFKKRKSLMQHVRKMHGPILECQICHVKVKRLAMERHMKKHHDYENYRCIECNAQYNSSVLLNAHLLEYHRKECLICSKIFATESRIRKHITSHCRNDKLECDSCHREFRSKFALRIHLNSRDKKQSCTPIKRTYKNLKQSLTLCSICGKTPVNYVSHMLQHSQTKRFKCDQCSYETNYCTGIKRHRSLHSGHRRFLCTECGQSFTQKVSLDHHAKQHKLSAEPISCSYCNEMFSTRFEVKVHAQKHGIGLYNNNTGIRSTPKPRQYVKLPEEQGFRCLQCDKEFMSTSLVRGHIFKNHERGFGSFKCTICNKEFDRYANMTNHIQLVHKKNSNFACSVCQVVFTYKKHLEIHMRAHTNERPYSCDICHAKFKTLTHVKHHKLLIHDGRRPFPCTFCTKAFKIQAALTEHVRTHTGERLKCDHCDKTFAGKSSRSKHLREVHNIRMRKLYSRMNQSKLNEDA